MESVVEKRSDASEEKGRRRPVTNEDRALGERIKQRREYLRLSQAEVAARMSKHTDRAVGHWESGYARISAVDLIELAKVLHCPVSYLTGEEEYNLTEMDRDWLGFMGRMLALLPAGRARDLYKQKLREDVERDSEFLRRIVTEDGR
jgi:transcriptional regulator with XRE-family HTH domain